MSCAARQKGLCLGIASIPCLTLQLSLSSPFPVPRLMMWRRHEAVMRCHGGGAPRVSQPLDARPTRIGSPPHSWLLGSPRSTSLASPSWMVEHLLPPSQKGSKSGAAPAQKGSDGPRPTGRELPRRTRSNRCSRRSDTLPQHATSTCWHCAGPMFYAKRPTCGLVHCTCTTPHR